MDQREQSRWRRTLGQLLRWRPTRTQLLWAGGIAALAFLVIVICGYLFGWQWTGLPNQTLWDWLQLLIIPAVLAGVGLWFNRQQREQELQTADRRAQDEALQAYIDQIGQLLLDKDRPLRQSKEDSEVRTLARARTLTVLGRLAPMRKGSVVRFLYESGLIARDHPVLDLSGSDLSGAYISGLHLRNVNLSEADLSGADLSFTRLDKTNLRNANLNGADLHGLLSHNIYLWDAQLSRANLSEAKLLHAALNQANLSEANLNGANLTGAKLYSATLREGDLTGANLSKVEGLSNTQLGSCLSLEGATMPDGQILKSDDNPDGPTFEEWLKSRGDGDSATPEQRGPWWGGPYHRPWWRRMFGA